MAFGVPYQQPGFAPGYYPMGQQMPAAMPDQLAQWRQGYQPAQQQQQATQQQSPIIWVTNYQAAENYMVAPNSAVVLWDSNSPVIYLKQCDASGKPTLKIYDLVERTAEQKQPPQVLQSGRDEFVTRAEFDALSARFDALTASKPLAKKKEDGNAKPTV